MENVKKEIANALSLAAKELGVENAQFSVDFPTVSSHGDLTTNIALTLFGSAKFKVQSSKFRTPLELAEEIVKILNTKYQIPYTDRIEAVSPGFINFWLKKDFFYDSLRYITSSIDTFGSSQKLKKEKIMIEFTDPNPFKEFHIGHLYTNAIGESLARLFESQGAEVARANYQGDVGLHVAKALYGLEGVGGIEGLDGKTLEEKVQALGQAYAAGSKAYEEDPKAKEEIHRINKMVYEKNPEIWDLYQKGRTLSLEYFEEMYKRLGTKFNHYYFESEVGTKGLEIVREHIKDGVFEESEGAIIFNGEPYGLHKRVFINSLGLPTYEAKELGLAPTKFKDFPYTASYIVTGNEVSDYFKVLIQVLTLINKDLGEKTFHVGHGMVRVEGGKMSSRTGSVITAEWLLSEIKAAIQKEYPDVPTEVLEQITVGSAKYSLLKSSIGHNIDFSFHDAVSFQGNSGPYLQYTFVRTQSILEKSEARNQRLEARNLEKLREKEETDILRHLVKFPEIVATSSREIAPHLLCLYLFELASLFNLFYQKHQVLKGEARAERLVLVSVIGSVLKKGLYLLGIQAPEKM